MHVLFSADAYLPRAGGSRVYYHNLYRRLHSEAGHRVTVLTKRVSGWEAFDAAVNASGFEIRRSGAPLASWKFHRIHELGQPLVKTLRTIRRDRPDMLHAGDLYPQGLVALLAKRICGIRYLAFCHGEEVTQMQKQRTEPRLRDLIYRHADRVVCASAFARKTLLETGLPAEKIEHITPGVDWERFRPGPPSRDVMERYRLEGKLVLLTTARLVPRKGHTRVLRAVATLLKEKPNLCYLIAGTGPEEARLREQAQVLGIEQHVRFAGYVPEAALPDLYRACDVMVMPNAEDEQTGDIEGFGMVFLEANAAGKPVVAGRSGGAAEPVADGLTGYLVDPLDVTELTAVLRRLLNHSGLRQQLGMRGSERARREFGWSSRAARLAACCEEISAGRSDRQGADLPRCRQRQTI